MTSKLPAQRDQAIDGPKMAKLRKRSGRMALFVEKLFEVRPGHKGVVDAAREAGYHNPSYANSLIHDEGVLDAIGEMTRKKIWSLGPQAVSMLQRIMSDPADK